jgi:hypothetical protein
VIDWFSFFVVFAVSIVAACGVVFLFSLGLRLVSVRNGWRKPAGIGCFVVCGLVILFGVYLIIPSLH